MPQMIKGFKFEQTLKAHIKESDVITETELEKLTGISKTTISLYFDRVEFNHITTTFRPKSYHGITETDIERLKALITRRFNRKTKTENDKSR